VTGEKKEQLVSIADRSFPIIEPSLKEMYDEKIVSFTRNFFRTLGGAPVLLVFYSVPTDEGNFVDTQSVSAAVENALLAATYEGLGTCWMTNPSVSRGWISWPSFPLATRARSRRCRRGKRGE
jgi:nitroreductase